MMARSVSGLDSLHASLLEQSSNSIARVKIDPCLRVGCPGLGILVTYERGEGKIKE